jgi:hypothetical protein
MLTKIEVLKIKAEIANLRRIANDLAPGTMRQELNKRAEALGKQIRPYSSVE